MSSRLRLGGQRGAQLSGPLGSVPSQLRRACLPLSVSACAPAPDGWAELGLPCCWGLVRQPDIAAAILFSVNRPSALPARVPRLRGREEESKASGKQRAAEEQEMGCQEEHSGSQAPPPALPQGS